MNRLDFCADSVWNLNGNLANLKSPASHLKNIKITGKEGHANGLIIWI